MGLGRPGAAGGGLQGRKLNASGVPSATAAPTGATFPPAAVRAGRVSAPVPTRPPAVTAPAAVTRSPGAPGPVRMHRGARHHPGGQQLGGDRGEGDLMPDITLD